MPFHYSQSELNSMIHDLKTAVEQNPYANDKLIYLTQKLADIENEEVTNIEYQYEDFDIIPEVEAITVSQLPDAEKKQVNLQFYLSTVPVMMHIDRVFLQQILFKLLANLLDAVPDGSVISIHVTDSDGKCIVEGINRSAVADEQTDDDYFKKYRITNSLQTPPSPAEYSLSVYKKIAEDMGSELIYNFTKKSQGNYFRLKFILA